MEQKRTIWIVLAAGIFLLVVIGTAVIIHSGDAKKDTTAIVQNEKGTVWMSPEVAQSRREDFLANSISSPAVEEKKDEPVLETPSVTDSVAAPAEGTTQIENMTLIATGNTNVYTIGAEGPSTIDLNADGALEPAESAPVAKTPAVTAKNQAAEVAIRETNTVKRNIETTDVLIENRYNDEPVVAEASSNKTTKVKKAPVSGKKAAPVNTVSASKPKASATVKSSAATGKVPDRFWVQCASYSAKKNADEAKAILEEKKIQCEVFTFTDAKGELHFRLRVGPYTTKGEADYWKKRIDEMPQFAKNGTFVTNTSK